MTEETVADRVIKLRKLLGYEEAKEFAKNFLGISASRWGHVEEGKPLSRQIAFLLVEKIDGMTLDWLYFGSRRPRFRTRRAIGRAKAAPSHSPMKRGKVITAITSTLVATHAQ